MCAFQRGINSRNKCGTSAAQVRHKCGTSAEQVRSTVRIACGTPEDVRRGVFWPKAQKHQKKRKKTPNFFSPSGLFAGSRRGADSLRNGGGTGAAPVRHPPGHRCGTGAAPVRHRCGTGAEPVRIACGTPADRRRTAGGPPADRRRTAGGTPAKRRRICGAASSSGVYKGAETAVFFWFFCKCAKGSF